MAYTLEQFQTSDLKNLDNIYQETSLRSRIWRKPALHS
ncbi:protein of unknown function [Aminobacter niigataensis]|nr:protein of unknown function [Aminobacter niigataensis]